MELNPTSGVIFIIISLSKIHFSWLKLILLLNFTFYYNYFCSHFKCTLAGWKDGWKDGWMDGQIDGLTDWQTDGLTDWRTDGLTDGLTDRQRDGRTDRLTNEQKGERADKTISRGRSMRFHHRASTSHLSITSCRWLTDDDMAIHRFVTTFHQRPLIESRPETDGGGTVDCLVLSLRIATRNTGGLKTCPSGGIEITFTAIWTVSE